MTVYGKIPDNWRVITIKEIANNNARLINPQQFQLETFALYSIPAYYTTQKPELINGKLIRSTKFLIEKDSILFGKINPRNPKVWKTNHNEPFRKLASTEYIPLSPNEETFYEFLYYLLSSDMIITKSKTLTSGTTPSRARVEPKRFLNLMIPFPRLEEQKVIATILKEIDELIQKTDQIIEQTRRLKTGLMQKLLTKGIRHIRYKEETLAYKQVEHIPYEWKITKLNRLCHVVRGSSPRPAGDPKYFGGTIPWITVGELTKDNHMYLDSVSKGLTYEGKIKSRFLGEGTILLVNSGATLGIPKILRIAGCINDGVAALLNLNKDALPEYIYYRLLLWVNLLRARNQGVFQLNINTSIIGNLIIPLPPIAEQKSIVMYIYDLEQYIQHYSSSKTYLEILKKGLSQKLLTGQIRVKV